MGDGRLKGGKEGSVEKPNGLFQFCCCYRKNERLYITVFRSVFPPPSTFPARVLKDFQLLHSFARSIL